jgi:S-formylglutathione hydrolase FrmB
MALCEIRWQSQVLQKAAATFVILPERDRGKPPFPTYYLLHGFGDDHSMWLRRTRIEIFAAQYPIAIVMPDGYHGFSTDNEQGPAYGKYHEEMVAVMERNFPLRPERSARAIGGLSMGGYGALLHGLTHPDKYCAAVSHSGALLHASRPWDDERAGELRRVFGADPRGSRHDLLHLARAAERGAAIEKLPALHIDCGTEDYLVADNRTFHAELEKLSIPHAYAEHPGAHDWEYWENHVRDGLQFVVTAFGIGAANTSESAGNG